MSTHGKLLDDLCDEVHSLKTQLVKQTKEPVICLVQNNVYVNYGSPVCWTEKKGRHAVFITADSSQKWRGWCVVDLAKTEDRARAGIADYPKIWTGHLKPICDRSRPY